MGQHTDLIAADLDIGILFIVAVTSLVTIGLMTGGWASNNKYSMLGGIRSAAQIISYEIPGAVAIVCIVIAVLTSARRADEVSLGREQKLIQQAQAGAQQIKKEGIALV